MTGIMIAMMGPQPPLARFVNVTADASSTGPVTVILTLQTDGTATFSGSPTLVPATGTQWFSPAQAGIGSSYWARCTINSGALTTNAGTGTWLALSTARAWGVNRNTVGVSACNFTLQIASDSGGTTIVGSATFTITCEMNN